MAGPTDAEEAAILDARLDRTGVYALGLFTTLPADDGTGGVEVSGGSYARINISASTTDWNAASGGGPSTKTGPKSGVTWAFAAPTADWGTIVGFGIWESTTLRWVGSLTASQVVHNGDAAPQFDSTHVITAQLGDTTDTF